MVRRVACTCYAATTAIATRWSIVVRDRFVNFDKCSNVRVRCSVGSTERNRWRTLRNVTVVKSFTWACSTQRLVSFAWQRRADPSSEQNAMRTDLHSIVGYVYFEFEKGITVLTHAWSSNRVRNRRVKILHVRFVPFVSFHVRASK